MQRAVSEMITRYGTAARFLQTFSPDLQLFAAKQPERAYFGTAPRLETVAAGYGEEVAIVWICVEVENLNNFAGVKEKMPVGRQKELARVILAEYPRLKTSELLLFFHRIKSGRYGRFYGMVDALFITSALVQFMDERQTETARFRADRQRQLQRAAASSPRGGITHTEYIELLKLKQKQENHGQK